MSNDDSTGSPPAPAADDTGSPPVQTEHLDRQFMEALEGILKDAGFEKDDPRARILLERVETFASYRGPLPPPFMLHQYDNVIPGLGDRIIEAWEAQQRHRHNLETTMAGRDDDRMDRSQRNALIVSIVGLGAATLVGIFGSWAAAAFIALAAVAGPNAASLLGRWLPPPRDQ